MIALPPGLLPSQGADVRLFHSCAFPHISFTSVHHRFPHELRSGFVTPQAPHLFARFGLKLPTGVLLWGPPGTGKSRLARAAAHAAGAQLLVLNGPDMLSSAYGDTEAALKVPVQHSSRRTAH